jgi:hypothetical protein
MEMYIEIVEKANIGWNRDQLEFITTEDVTKEKVIKRRMNFFFSGSFGLTCLKYLKNKKERRTYVSTMSYEEEEEEEDNDELVSQFDFISKKRINFILNF